MCGRKACQAEARENSVAAVGVIRGRRDTGLFRRPAGVDAGDWPPLERFVEQLDAGIARMRRSMLEHPELWRPSKWARP